jgi:tRNA-2-methylthio-N6-dimethylallyladenosine synthase
MTAGRGPSKRYFIETHGCQMNIYDSQFIADLLERHGYRRAASPEEASVVILNTCSVRDRAERKALSHMRDFAAIRRKRPELLIAVVGCMAQRLGRQLAERRTKADLVVGFDAYASLADLLKQCRGARDPVVAISEEPSSLYGARPRKRTSVSAFVTIMQGCDNFCSYCIVPYVRGRERSRSPQAILDEISHLVSLGVREVVLIGQNVNSYRHHGTDFTSLLGLANEIRGLDRLRFTTSHPKDLTLGLIEAVRDLPKVCGHLHLPLQSGSDRILSLMNRGYTFGDFRKIVDLARYEIGRLAVTTDLMVGFPTESEADFQGTFAAVEAVEFDAAFMFRYSPRDGTRAACMADDVPGEEKTRRLRALLDLQNRITDKKKRALLGQEVEVLLEGPSSREPGFMVGRTRENWLAKIPRKGVRRGETVVAAVTDVTRWMVVCDNALRKVGS